MAERPNVLFILLDSARSMNIGCYGGPDGVTPNIDALADDGVQFNRAVANAPWTLPSHASMFTGTQPTIHGAHSWHQALNEEQPTIADILTEAGYETIAVSNNGWLSQHTGLLRGFERKHVHWKLFQTETDFTEPYRRYIKNSSITGLPKGIYQFVHEIVNEGSPVKDLINGAYGWTKNNEYHHSGAGVVRTLLQEIDNTTEPFFGFVNLLEPHLPCFPPEPYRSRFLASGQSVTDAKQLNQDVQQFTYEGGSFTEQEAELLKSLYTGEIAHVDEFVGTTINYLKQNNLYDDTVVVVVGDHGEQLGEHGRLGHLDSLYESVLRVPLIVKPPGSRSGTEVERYAQPSDLFRTLLNQTVTECPEHPDLWSYDLLGDHDRDIAVGQFAGLEGIIRSDDNLDFERMDVDRYLGPLNAVYQRGNKLILEDSNPTEFYDLIEDQNENENLIETHREEASALQSTLSDTPGGPLSHVSQAQGPVDNVTTRLKQLGYF